MFLLESDNLSVLRRLFFQSLSLRDLLHLELLILGHNGVPSGLLLSHVGLESSFLLHLPLMAQFVFASAVLVVPLADLHGLLSSFFGLLDLLPGLLLLQLEQRNTIGKELGIVGSLLFIHTGGYEGSGDLALPIIIDLILVLAFIILILVRSFSIFLVLVLKRMRFSLWHLLSFLWRFVVLKTTGHRLVSLTILFSIL